MTGMKSLIDLRAETPLSQCELAKVCGVTPQAFSKWVSKGRLPRTEFTGETNYAEKIEAATNGALTKLHLLEWSKKEWERAA